MDTVKVVMEVVAVVVAVVIVVEALITEKRHSITQFITKPMNEPKKSDTLMGTD